MTAFYKCYKRTHEVNDPDAPVYRAIQYSKDRHEEIMKLCDTLEADFGSDYLTEGEWFVEDPYLKMPNGNIGIGFTTPPNLLSCSPPSP